MNQHFQYYNLIKRFLIITKDDLLISIFLCINFNHFKFLLLFHFCLPRNFLSSTHPLFLNLCLCLEINFQKTNFKFLYFLINYVPHLKVHCYQI